MKSALTILGCTGSVGMNTLDVVARHRDLYDVFALSARNNVVALAEQCKKFKPRYAVITNETHYAELKQALRGQETKVLAGAAALEHPIVDEECDMVVAGIAGVLGLRPLLSAVRAGKRVLFANKEPMVAAGALLKRECRQSGAQLLPLDSEHNALMQCLVGEVEPVSMTLTASGGPLLRYPLKKFKTITPEQACAHPNWEMGAKISVDSATMMNKGLEIIEAVDLFDFSPEQVGVLIHPQSVVHGFVTHCDGSTIAQMASPDMRVPIACALAWPERIHSGAKDLDLATIGRLDFSDVDETRFPCFALAKQALRSGSEARILLNAANEVAVAAFLRKRLRFDLIASVIEDVLSHLDATETDHVDAILHMDERGRRLAEESIRKLGAE